MYFSISISNIGVKFSSKKLSSSSKMNRDMYGIRNFFVLERSGQDFPVTLYFIINTELQYEDGVYLW